MTLKVALLLLLLGLGLFACLPKKTELPPLASRDEAFVLALPKFLRDPEGRVQRLVNRELRRLDQALGGGILSVYPLDIELECWRGARAIPHAECHEEALALTTGERGNGALWGYVLNQKTGVFLLYGAAKGASTSRLAEPEQRGGLLTPKDLLRWFGDVVLDSARAGALPDEKAERIASRLLEAGLSDAEKDRPLYAEAALLSAHLSLFRFEAHKQQPALERARAGYLHTLELSPTKPVTPQALSARLGLAYVSLLGAQIDGDPRAAAQALAAFRSLQRTPGVEQEASRGTAQALALVGTLASDPARLLESARLLAQLAPPQEDAAAPSFARLEPICRLAAQAASLDERRATEALALCLEPPRQGASAEAEPTQAHAAWLLYRGSLELLSGLQIDSPDLLAQAQAHLTEARAAPSLEPSLRPLATRRLAQVYAELGLREASAAALQRAAALYQSSSPRPFASEQSLALVLAELARISPSRTNTKAALEQLSLVLEGVGASSDPELLLRRNETRAQLATYTEQGSAPVDSSALDEGLARLESSREQLSPTERLRLANLVAWRSLDGNAQLEALEQLNDALRPAEPTATPAVRLERLATYEASWLRLALLWQLGEGREAPGAHCADIGDLLNALANESGGNEESWLAAAVRGRLRAFRTSGEAGWAKRCTEPVRAKLEALVLPASP
jgi:hypothetical protein